MCEMAQTGEGGGRLKWRDTCGVVEWLFPGGVFDRVLWREYAGGISPLLPDKLEQDAAQHNYTVDILPVLNATIARPEAIDRTRASFRLECEGLEERLCSRLGVAPTASVVLYLGLCNGAGWATELDGADVVLLGLEKIIELGWHSEEHMRALVYHELGHVWHKQIRGTPHLPPPTPVDAPLWLLYTEGVAMVCEQLLCDDSLYYHQDKAGWLTWCLAHEQDSKREYLRRVRHAESVQDFFGDWHNYRGYADVGYFLGAQFVRYMLAQNTIWGIARMEAAAVRQAFAEYAAQE